MMLIRGMKYITYQNNQHILVQTLSQNIDHCRVDTGSHSLKLEYDITYLMLLYFQKWRKMLYSETGESKNDEVKMFFMKKLAICWLNTACSTLYRLPDVSDA